MAKRTLKEKNLQLIREIATGETPVGLLRTKALRALLLLSQAAGYDRGVIYSCPTETLRELLNCRDDEVLREELMALRGQTWNWPGLSAREGWCAPIPALRWKGSIVEWEVSALFLRALQERNMGYVRTPWAFISGFSGQYALRLWEICMAVHQEGKTTETRIFNVPELRAALGIAPEAYRNVVSGMLHHCVKLPLTEVLELTGLNIELCKRGRGGSLEVWFRVHGTFRQQQMLLSETVVRQVKRDVPVPLKAKLIAAMNALPPERRAEVENSLLANGLPSLPPDDPVLLKSYAGALRGFEVLA